MPRMYPRVVRSGSKLAIAVLAGAAFTAQGQVRVAAADDWSRSIWSSAWEGRSADMFDLLNRRPALEATSEEWLSQSVERLAANIAKRESARAEEIAKVSTELDEALAKGDDDLSLCKALRSAVELHMISLDKRAVLEEPRVRRLRDKAEAAARAAEERGDWFASSELFARLDNLYEDSGEFKKDLRRQGARLGMIRLYTPERFWELRNARKVAEDGKPLPPYNPVGDAWDEKLTGITRPMVVRAVERSAAEHVEHSDLSRLLKGALESLQTMVKTDDLAGAFPGLKNPEARARMLATLAEEELRLNLGARPGDTDQIVRRVLEANRESVRIADAAVLHEFGNGGMATLDEFSAIIWPDEIRRFNKNTQGNFIGVGIHIQLDELSNIRVVTPLEGTPAQRAGVRAGDIIKKVNGKPTIGFSLDQAVDVITGPSGTPVTLTLEREIELADGDRPEGEPAKADEPAKTEEIDFKLVRARIEVSSVKGWRRIGAREDSWDWLIDPQSKIGYVRLSGFTEKTDMELDRAIDQMRGSGVRGVILDLRFNPGGLLEQATAVASRFVDPPADDRFGGLIVSTHAKDGTITERQHALSNRARLGNVPVVVLMNEGSASASEIVAGAIKDYAAAGVVQGVTMGQRTFGKGSVQNVWQLPGSGVLAAVKLTTAYWHLPGGGAIHRHQGEPIWGVEPNVSVEMLPKQIADAFILRQNADVIKIDQQGIVQNEKDQPPNPDDLLTKGLDLQLEHALVLLQAQVAGQTAARAERDAVPEVTRKN